MKRIILFLLFIFLIGNSQTRNIVPRATGEGQIGTSAKHWRSAYLDSLFNTYLISTIIDSDSSRDDGVTWRTSTNYHSGLGASSFGNIQAGTATFNGAVTSTSTVQATNAKLTGLNDNYIPYHISDAAGLGNSQIYISGTDSRVSSGNFIVDAGYADADSFRLNGTTAITSGSWHSGLGALSTGALTAGSLTGKNLTSGSVLFAGSGGAVSQDNSNFYWDNVNKRLGIGLSSGIDSNLTVNNGAWIKRGLRVDGATSTGAITSTGLTTTGIITSTYQATGFTGAFTSRSPVARFYASGTGANGVNHAQIMFASNDTTRWAWRKDNTAESGGNTGSDFFLSAYNDAGVNFMDPIKVTRSTGGVRIHSTNQFGLTLYRSTPNLFAASSGINFDAQTANSTQVTYASINGQIQSNSNSLQSGGLVLNTYRSAVSTRALFIDSLQNVFIGTQTAFPLTDSRLLIRSNVTGAYALSVIPSNSTAKVFAVDTSGNLTVNGAVKNVGGLATTGPYGVAPIVDTINYSGVGSSIAARNLPSAAGRYRLVYSLFTTTAGSAGTVLATLSYNNGAAQTQSTATVQLNSTSISSGGVTEDQFIYTVASGTPTISTTVSGAAGSPVYTFKATVERIQ